MTEEKAKAGRARIVASTAPMELRDVQFIIEAASEKFEGKKEIFRELGMQAGPKQSLPQIRRPFRSAGSPTRLFHLST